MDIFKNNIPLSSFNKFTFSKKFETKKDKLNANISYKKSEELNISNLVNDSSNKENISNYSPNKQNNYSPSNKSNSRLSLDNISNEELPYTVQNTNKINIPKYIDSAKFYKKTTNDNLNKNRIMENIVKIIKVNKDEHNRNNNIIKKKPNIYKREKNRTIDYVKSNTLLSDLLSDTNSENKNVMVSELDIQLTNDELKQENNENNPNIENQNNEYKIKSSEDNFKKEIELNIKQFLKQNLEEKKRKQKNNLTESNGNLTERSLIKIKKIAELNKINKNKNNFKNKITRNLSKKQKINMTNYGYNTLTLNKSVVYYNEINKKKFSLKELKNRIGFNSPDCGDYNRRSFIYYNKNNKGAFNNFKQSRKFYNTINVNNTNNSNNFYNSSVSTSYKNVNSFKRFIQRNSNISKEKNKKIDFNLNNNKGNFYNFDSNILGNRNRYQIYENTLSTNLEPKIYFKNNKYFTESKDAFTLKECKLKQKIKVKQLNLMNESLINRKLFNKENKIKNPICYSKKLNEIKNYNSAKRIGTRNNTDNQFIYYKKIITVNRNSKNKYEK